MKFRFGAIALALLLVVAATGCGSKKKAAVTTSAAPAVTTTATTTSSSGGSSGGSTTPTTTSSSKPSFESVKNCAQLESIGAKFSAAVQSSVGAGGKIDFSKETQLFKALADASPSAIHGDFETLSAAFSSVAAAYDKADITAGKTPTPAQLAELESVSKSFSAPKVVAAEKHLESWASANCAGVK